MIRPDLSLPIPEHIEAAHFIGIGGSGMFPTYPSPFDTDAGIGGGGLMPPPILGEQDAGLR